MLSSALSWLTPGGRRRQGNPPVDEVVNEDAVAVSSSSPSAVGIEQGQPSPALSADGDAPSRDSLRTNLFAVDRDCKYGDDGDSDDDASLQVTSRQPRYTTRSKSLPKIVYSKLVTLSLSNFAAYRESIKVCGYSRGWPSSLRDPSVDDLAVPWNGIDGNTVADEIRREAFMVLYQTIPSSLKYLVEDVRSGDVIAVWKILYDRFLHVTDVSLKKMKKEWESLSQGSMKLDEFISLVSSKARSMKMVKLPVSDHDKAIALLYGLSKDYDWLKNAFSMMPAADYTFADVATAALRVAVDRKLIVSASPTPAVKADTVDPSPPPKKKDVCYNFNTKGCSSSSCRYRHETVSPVELEKLKSKIGKRDKKKKVLVASSASSAPVLVQTGSGKGNKKPYCYKCFSKDHLISDCPLKQQINEYIKKLTGVSAASAETKTTALVSSQLTLPLFFAKNDVPKSWIIDSGAAHHITNDFQQLSDPVAVPPNSTVFTVGNDHVMSPTHSGSVMVGGVKVTNVFLCQECPVNILSESRLLLAGVDISKNAHDSSTVLSVKGVPVMTAVLKNGLFVVDNALNGSKLSPL